MAEPNTTTAASENKQVGEPIPAYEAMAEHWELIDDLIGGTLAMQMAGEKWLPKEPAEELARYTVRLNRSVLFGAYRDTVKDLASKPFAKPVTLQGNMPEKLADIAANVDGEGANITQFARQLLTTAINRGLTHVLVDYPNTANPEDGTPRKISLAEE